MTFDGDLHNYFFDSNGSLKESWTMKMPNTAKAFPFLSGPQKNIAFEYKDRIFVGDTAGKNPIVKIRSIDFMKPLGDRTRLPILGKALLDKCCFI